MLGGKCYKMKGARAFTDTEIELVKSKLNNFRDYVLFVVSLKTGFRISETLSLRVKDVYEYGKMCSHATVARINMKGNKSSRTVAIHPEASENILKLINQYNLEHDDYLFQSREGNNKPISSRHAWSILKVAFRLARLQGKCSTHSCRKSFAQRLYKASGNSLIKTQKGLGHSSISSTISYLSVDDEEIDSIILNLK